jgi:molecular chaperone GrpE
MEEKELEVEKEIQKEEPDWKDSYLRLLADFDNFKKRNIKEKEEIKLKAKLDTLSSVLELDNDLHLAQKVIKDSKSLEAVKIITDKLSSFLKSKGFEEVQTERYDEDLHEVISVLETGKEGIVDVVAKGWKLNGQIVKYPKVIISK